MTGRIAVVDGLRTPFARRGTAYADLVALDLATPCCAELVSRACLGPDDVDLVVLGQVILDVERPNLAREVVLRTPLSPRTPAHTVSQMCITGYRATVTGAQSIRDGEASVVLAGGADSTSAVPLLVSDRLETSLKSAQAARTPVDRARALADVRPRDLVPRVPDLAEPSTGETMGEATERMAKLHRIPRADQDEFAHRSHVLAARAWNEGRFDEEVMALPVPPRYDEVVERDETVRFDSDLRRYGDLRPAFDRDHGTVTAGNSSPLTDGAAALLLMAEETAEALGHRPLGYLRSVAFTGVDPADQLLIGPVHAIPMALERAGATLADMDLVDMHEAFAAQVLSVLATMEDAEYSRDRLGREEPVGAVDPDVLNVTGGSIALGHPFAATGIRQIVQTLRELRRRDGELALVSACAAGGLAAAMVLEAA